MDTANAVPAAAHGNAASYDDAATLYGAAVTAAVYALSSPVSPPSSPYSTFATAEGIW